MGQRCDCKVDSVVREFNLEDPRHPTVHEGLLERWCGDGSHKSQGYRPLTAWFNKRVLRTVYEKHNRNTLDHRLEADYETLTGEDDLRRQEIESELRANGVKVESLTDALVSWGTIRNHLTECLDGEKQAQEASTDWQRETVERAQTFAATKTEETLSSLEANSEIDGAEKSTVDVEIRLRCSECPTTVRFEAALRRGFVCERHRTDKSGVEAERQ